MGSLDKKGCIISVISAKEVAPVRGARSGTKVGRVYWVRRSQPRCVATPILLWPLQSPPWLGNCTILLKRWMHSSLPDKIQPFASADLDNWVSKQKKEMHFLCIFSCLIEPIVPSYLKSICVSDDLVAWKLHVVSVAASASQWTLQWITPRGTWKTYFSILSTQRREMQGTDPCLKVATWEVGIVFMMICNTRLG